MFDSNGSKTLTPKILITQDSYREPLFDTLGNHASDGVFVEF